MLKEDRDGFVKLVDETLIKHFAVIKNIVKKGTYFFDYGNSFMQAIFDACCLAISKNGVD